MKNGEEIKDTVHVRRLCEYKARKNVTDTENTPIKRKRGRPRKEKQEEKVEEGEPKRRRGRPRKKPFECNFSNFTEWEESEIKALPHERKCIRA